MSLESHEQSAVENIHEQIDILLTEDYDLQNALAYKLLDDYEHYLFCKESAWDLLANRYEQISEKAIEKWMECEGSTPDARELIISAFNLDL